MMASALAACGPERDLSGVWRLEACRPEGERGEAPACGDDPFVYELHLGRFGDDVTGLLVPYVFQGANLDSFDKPNERGCHYLNSGRADGDTLTFVVEDPACEPAAGDDPVALCGRASAVIGCGRAFFALRGDDTELAGEIQCSPADGASGATRVYAVRFVPESGRPRTRPCEAE
jgi:hypothetical protein